MNIYKIKQFITFTQKYVFLTKEEEKQFEDMEKIIKQAEIDFEKAKIEFKTNCKNDPNYIYKVLF